ncbi:MAG: hypothetical protein M1834_006199 [Cirrosporium novae-zelandiae]|nr:MAG: hypothetical protein M1834_006199 [Cirrosporium novae-zelandiae]
MSGSSAINITDIFGPAPTGLDLTESETAGNNAAVITLMIVATVTVGLRLYARSTQKTPLGLDDYSIILALLAAIGTGVDSLIAGTHGIGKHVWAVSVPDVVEIGKYNNPTENGYCINTTNYFIGNAIASMITDVLILMVPVPIVWHLQMPRPQRIMVLGIFGLGAFVCAASVVRIQYLWTLKTTADFTWVMGRCFIWSSVEPCIGIVCACLPTLRPLFRGVFKGWFNTSARGKSSVMGNSGTDIRSGHNRDFMRLSKTREQSDLDDDEMQLTNVVGTGSGSVATKDTEDRKY